MAKRKAVKNYRDLEVWQRGMDLVESVYRVTESFPKSEKFGLMSQLRRAAVSVPSNIAEGWGRGSRKAYVRFLRIARSSLMEVETQLLIAHRLNYLDERTVQKAIEATTAESKMLLALIRSLQK